MRTVSRRHKCNVSPAFHRYLLPRQLTRTAALNHISARILPQVLPCLYDLTPDRFPTRRKAYDAIKERLLAPFQNQLFLARYMEWNSEKGPPNGYRTRLWHDLTPHTPDDTLSCCEVLKALSDGARTMTFLHDGIDLVRADTLSWRYFHNLGDALCALGFQSNTIVPYVSWRIIGVLDGSWSAERVISSTWRKRSVADDACEEHDTFVDADLDAGRIDDKDTSMIFHTLMSEPFLRNDKMVSQWMKSLGWKVKLDSRTHQIQQVLTPLAPANGYQGVEENQDAGVPSTSQPRDSSETTHADSEESPRVSDWNRPRKNKSSDQAAFSNQSAVVPTAITDAKPIARSAWEETPSTTEESNVQRTSWEDPEPSAPTDVLSTSSRTDMENSLLGSNSSTGGSLSDSDAWELLNTKKAPAPGQDSETPVTFTGMRLSATRDVHSLRTRQRKARRRERETGREPSVAHDLNVLQQLQSSDSRKGTSGSGLPVSTASSTSSPSSVPWFHAAGRERVSHNNARDGVGAQQSSASPGSEQLARLARNRKGGTYRDEGGSWDKQQGQLPPEQPDSQTFPFLAWLGTSAAAFMHFPLIQHLKQQQQKRKSGSGQLENMMLRVTEADQKWTFYNEEGRSMLTRPIPRKDQFQELREWWQQHDKADGRDINPAHIYLRYLEHHYLNPEQNQGSIVPLMEHLVQDQPRPGELDHTTLSVKVNRIDSTYFFHDGEGRQLYKRRQPNVGEHQKLKQWWQQQRPRQEHGKSAYQEHDKQVPDGQIWLILLKQRLLQQQREQQIQSRQPSESSAAQEEAAVDPSSPTTQQPIKQSEQPQVVPLDLQPLVNYILQYQQERRPGDSKDKLPPELTCSTTKRRWIFRDGNGVILFQRSKPTSNKRGKLWRWWQQQQQKKQRQLGQPSDECEHVAPPSIKIWVENLEQTYVQMLSSSAKGEAADVSPTPSSTPPLGRSEKEEVSPVCHQDRIREPQDLTSTRHQGSRARWISRDKRGHFLSRTGKVSSKILQREGITHWKFRRVQSHERMRLRQWATEPSNVMEGDKGESGSRIARIPPPQPQRRKWEQKSKKEQFATSSSANGEGAENTTVPLISSPPPAEQQQESKEQESRSLMSRLDKISQGKTK